MQMDDGTYAAKPGKAVVYESDGGALVLSLEIRFSDGQGMPSYHTLVNKDGALNTRTIENLKAWSGWDGLDPFWFVEADLSAVDIEVVIENEPGFKDATRLFPKVKWVNPPGGGGSGLPRESGDRRTLLAKYGAKFRALAGGTPPAQPVRAAAPQAPARPSAPPARPPIPAARQAPKPPATQEACWNRLCELLGTSTQEQKESAWFAAVDTVGGGQRDQGDFGPDDWAALLTHIETETLPY